MNVILLITACFAGLLMAASISEAADISGSAKHRTVPHNRTDIYFAAFFPLTPVGSLDAKIGHGVMPAVRLAIKHINQSPNILKGYKLHMYWNDTQVLVNLSLISIISKILGCVFKKIGIFFFNQSIQCTITLTNWLFYLTHMILS